MEAQTIAFTLIFVVVTIPAAALGAVLTGLMVPAKQAVWPWLSGLLVLVVNMTVTVACFSLWNSYFKLLKHLRPRPEAVELLMHIGAATILFGAGPSVVVTLTMLALARYRPRIARKAGQ